MIGTLKMIGIVGAVVGAGALAQPAMADNGRHGGFSIGIGVNVRSSPRVTRTVVVGPQYYAPPYIAAPLYGYQPYIYPSYQPNYYYVPPVYYAPQVVYPYSYYNNYSYNVPYARQQQRLTFGLIGRW